jgi:hypothetical protein
MLWELSMAYKIAWDRELAYISPIQMAKQTSFHPAMLSSLNPKMANITSAASEKL